jgi:hypothetical protein
MADCTATLGLRRGVFVALLLLAQSRTLVAQAQGEKRSPSVVCSIRTERKVWSRTKPAILYVTVESVSDIPFEIPLWAGLSLEPVAPSNRPLTRLKNEALGASVNPTVFDPLGLPSNAVIRDGKGERSMFLKFAHSGEKANLKFDASDLIWDFEVTNRTPAFKLFDVAKPGAYDLQFQMTWEGGACESAKVALTMEQGKPPKSGIVHP